MKDPTGGNETLSQTEMAAKNIKNISGIDFIHPLDKLRHIAKMSHSFRHQLWVVAYVNQEGQSPLLDQALADVENSMEGGADAVVLINEWSSLWELESTLDGVRVKYPQIPLGINYLGDDRDPYGYVDSFRLAREYNLQIVWTDFSGVDLIHEKEGINLQDIQKLRPSEVFYASGIHMKYSTPKQPQKTIEESALQAMGWVDGVIVTGSKTGVPCNPETAVRARRALRDYPLGVASGVSAENYHQLEGLMDFALVASSLQDPLKRIVKEKVRDLRRTMGSRSWSE